MSYPDDLLKAEDATASKLSEAFLSSVEATKAHTEWDAIIMRLMEEQDPDRVVTAIRWQEYDPTERLGNLLSVSARVQGRYIENVAGMGYTFDYVNPEALAWIDQYGASEIKYISDSQKEAIKGIVRTGYESGITPRDQARQIKEHIGLDPRRSESLARYAENLAEKGYPEDRIWPLVEKKSETLLNERAFNIAINEASEASAQGGYVVTQDAVKRGILPADEYEAYRIVTWDDRLCPKCRPLANEGREIPDGTYKSTGRTNAKVHFVCRCVEGIRKR